VTRNDLLFAELSGERKSGESVSLGRDVASLAEASKNKRTVIGVVIDWEP
jgi:hypothetical protein